MLGPAVGPVGASVGVADGFAVTTYIGAHGSIRSSKVSIHAYQHTAYKTVEGRSIYIHCRIPVRDGLAEKVVG